MPRAKRFFLPGYIYHITHRCHNREFLLRRAIEKMRWVHWLAESIERFGLKVLNYCITDNHIHLIAHPESSRTVLAESMHLIAGRVGQEYNERQKRRGAFWEDRYHATAIQSHQCLLRCMVYIDLNMVRAGVVKRPEEWPYCGFREMIGQDDQRGLIDRRCLRDSAGVSTWEAFVQRYRLEVEDVLKQEDMLREDLWTRSIAVGDRPFVNELKQRLIGKARYREIVEPEKHASDSEILVLREPEVPYESAGTAIGFLEGDNLIRWDEEPGSGESEFYHIGKKQL